MQRTKGNAPGPDGELGLFATTEINRQLAIEYQFPLASHGGMAAERKHDDYANADGLDCMH
jgi:hypothetical protein